jgi:cell division protein FtsA
VLTGGSAMLPGMVELGEDVFLKQVRVGTPGYRGHLSDVISNPRFSTAMGLLEEARIQWIRGRKDVQSSGSFKDTLSRMKAWFVGNF